ncbi:MAG TPA: hypothetical protein VGG76_00635 [Gemmatimonadaceae bacterium]
MRKPTGLSCLLATVLAIGCRDRGPAGPTTDELSKLSPEIFSHTDEAGIRDAPCLGGDGVLVSPSNIGPVRLGRRLQSLRQSCAIALVKVPASAGFNGPVFGVSAAGGLILFTVAGRDSAVQTAGTSNPAFRTRNGMGVGSSIRDVRIEHPGLCFKHDSAKVIEVFVSRRRLKC